jgi:orotidine-5'-phosphate decarboxylase
MNDARSRLIVALDVPDRATALGMVDRLSGHVGIFKIGLELFTSEGPRLVEEIHGRGERIFLDLKLHDIPNTVRSAVRSISRLGIQMLTIHAAGGSNMMAAACQEAESSPSPLLLLGVTALTSLSEEDVRKLGITLPVEQWVERLARVAQESGIRGLVASSRELPMLRAKFGNSLQLVIPGIRPAGAAAQDQSRTATPFEAISAGANYIVVGRPILQAADPSKEADAIVEEISRV